MHFLLIKTKFDRHGFVIVRQAFYKNIKLFEQNWLRDTFEVHVIIQTAVFQ